MTEGSPLLSRRLTTPHTPVATNAPALERAYHVMLTNAGAGWSTCRELDVTRWREDITRDNWGQFCYLRDLEGGFVWSAGYQPIGSVADEFEATFAADKVSFRRRDGAIETLWEITVSTEQLAEVRRLTLSNHDDRPRKLELTSYGEVVLGPPRRRPAHPAFGKLFLETEWLPGPEALLAGAGRARPSRSRSGRSTSLAGEGPTMGVVEYETDRVRFLGRGRSPADPAALDPGRCSRAPPGRCSTRSSACAGGSGSSRASPAIVAFTTAVADTREEALTLADHYPGPAPSPGPSSWPGPRA